MKILSFNNNNSNNSKIKEKPTLPSLLWIPKSPLQSPSMGRVQISSKRKSRSRKSREDFRSTMSETFSFSFIFIFPFSSSFLFLVFLLFLFGLFSCPSSSNFPSVPSILNFKSHLEYQIRWKIIWLNSN